MITNQNPDIVGGKNKVRGCVIIPIMSISLIALFIFLYFIWGKSWTWDQLQNAPNNASEIISYDESFILFIKSKDQKYYQCEIRYDELDCELITKNLITEHPDLCTGNKLIFPRPPGRAISRKDFHLCGPDMKLRLVYVILEDGSIWEHWSGSSWGDIIVIQFLIILGIIVGAIFGLIYVKRKNQDQINYSSIL